MSHSRTAPIGKLSPPRLPAIVERSRLYRLLDRARKRPIVWINAPPGFGKTTLVAGYLRARKLHPLWYQVEIGILPPSFTIWDSRSSMLRLDIDDHFPI